MDSPDRPEVTVHELQEKLAAEIANARRQRQRAQAAEARVAELEPRSLSDDDLSLFEQLRQAHGDDQAQAEALRQQFEQEAQARRQQHADELAAREEQINTLSTLLRNQIGMNRLRSALGAAGVKSELIGQAADLLGPNVRVRLDGEEAQVEVVDGAGEVMTADGRPATVDQLVQTWAANNPHFLPASGDTGSGATRGGSAEPITYAQLRRNPARLAEYIRTHGEEAVYRLG